MPRTSGCVGASTEYAPHAQGSSSQVVTRARAASSSSSGQSARSSPSHVSGPSAARSASTTGLAPAQAPTTRQSTPAEDCTYAHQRPGTDMSAPGSTARASGTWSFAAVDMRTAARASAATGVSAGSSSKHWRRSGAGTARTQASTSRLARVRADDDAVRVLPEPADGVAELDARERRRERRGEPSVAALDVQRLLVVEQLLGAHEEASVERVERVRARAPDAAADQLGDARVGDDAREQLTAGSSGCPRRLGRDRRRSRSDLVAVEPRVGAQRRLG